MAEIQRVAVLGAGTMGAGIAQVAAHAGCQVLLRDLEAEFVERALASIEANLDKAVVLGKLEAVERDALRGRIRGTTDLAEAVVAADLVIEAAPERLELKQVIFREVSARAPRHALLASNTSSLSITTLARAAEGPERCLGLHFFNPVHLMKLLEVVRGDETSEETLAAARAFGIRLGKTIIEVRDSPGFATSRLGVLLGLEAIRMLEAGVASAADIDTAMQLGYGHPMGPLRQSDLVGLDVRLGIAEYLHSSLGGEAFRPPDLLRRMVAEGKLGKKSGRGFYDWSER